MFSNGVSMSDSLSGDTGVPLACIYLGVWMLSSLQVSSCIFPAVLLSSHLNICIRYSSFLLFICLLESSLVQSWEDRGPSYRDVAEPNGLITPAE